MTDRYVVIPGNFSTKALIRDTKTNALVEARNGRPREFPLKQAREWAAKNNALHATKAER